MCRCRIDRNGYIPDEREGNGEHDGANGARLPLEEESGEVENHEDGVVVQQRRVHGLRYQQHGDEPLQAVHLACSKGNGEEEDYMYKYV